MVNGSRVINAYLELRIVVHENGDDAYVRHESLGTADDVFALEPELSWCIKTSIVDRVVVPFGQVLGRAVFSDKSSEFEL